MEQDVRQVMDLEVDVKNQLIFKNSVEIILPDLTRKLFFALLKKTPEPSSMADLARDVWEEDYVSEETIAQRVSLLRRALKTHDSDLNYIQAVRGKGYRINLHVPSPPKERNGRPQNKGTTYFGVILAIIMAAVAGGYFYQSSDYGKTNKDLPTSGATLIVSDLIQQAENYQSGQRLEDIHRAISIYKKVLELDAANIDAQIGLSFSLSTKATKFNMNWVDIEKAESLARDVLKDDNQNSAAWHALAYALDGQGQIDKAVSFYLRAFELNPNDYNAGSSAAYLLAIKGRLYEALMMEAQLLKVGQSTLYSEIQIAFSLDQLGFQNVAQNWLDKALTMHPDHPVMLAFYIRLKLRHGEFAQAEKLYQRYTETLQQTPRIKSLRAKMTIVQSSYTELQLALEQKNVLRQELDIFMPNIDTGLIDDDEGNLWPDKQVYLAYYHVLKGNQKLALKALGVAVDLGWRDAEKLQNYPFFEHLKKEAEFKKIIARIDEEINAQKELIFSNDDLIKRLGIKP